MSESAQITTVLIGLALALAAVVAGRTVRRDRYPARPTPPYARFREPAPGEQLLACEGRCEGVTPHETDGEDTATCVTCGTPRQVLAPDAA
jgi:hypothetical protein